MKKFGLFVLIAFVAACSSDKSSEAIKQQIIKKKEQIGKLKQEIIELEKQLSGDSLNTGSENRIPVIVKQLTPVTFRHYIELSGTLEAKKDAYVSPEMGGQIKYIHTYEGDYVMKGQRLVTLNTSVTESSINEVKTGLSLATKVFEKQEALWNQGIGSEIQYLEAKNNKEAAENRLKTLQAQLEMSIIRAPFDGIVDAIYQKEGELAAPGMRIMQIVNLSNLEINADISEAYLTKVKKGEMVDVSFPAFPDITYNLPVTRTGNVINPGNRTFDVQIDLKNKNNQLKPNIIAVLKINDATIDSALVVPSIIIKKDITTRDGLNEFLFVAEEENGVNVAKKVYVKSGISYKDQTVIQKGLTKGQKVIVEGYNTVSNNTEVEIK